LFFICHLSDEKARSSQSSLLKCIIIIKNNQEKQQYQFSV
jgi:hypothetical protein